MVTFLIVRHGFSQTNKAKIFAGVLNPTLDEQGIVQGKLACDYIRKNYKVDAIYSSDLIRAVDTVKTLSEAINIPIIKSKAFREMDCGIWEGLHIDVLLAKYGDQFKRWSEIDDTAIPEGGESWLETSERVYNEFLRVASISDNKTVVVATHGVAIRAFRGKYLGIPMNEWKDKLPYAPNASITVVEFENGKFFEKDIIDEYLGELKTEMPKGI